MAANFQEKAPDPWLLLRQLARDGLGSVAIEVKVDGEEVPVTDLAFEIAESGELPADASPDLKASVKAAIILSDLDSDAVEDIAEKAREGDEWAQRCYQALVLRELVKFRSMAKRIVARMASGDEQAKAGAKGIFQKALSPGPGQPRARVAAYLLRDAILSAQKEASP